SKPARALLNLADLMVLPPNGVCTDSIHVETDPDPSTQDSWRLAMDPAVQAFEVIAINLADTLTPLAGALEGSGIDSTKALGLERELRRVPRRPLVAQEAKLSDIELQVDRMTVRSGLAANDSHAIAQRTVQAAESVLDDCVANVLEEAE